VSTYHANNRKEARGRKWAISRSHEGERKGRTNKNSECNCRKCDSFREYFRVFDDDVEKWRREE